MNNFEFAVPCLFGLEGIAGDELRRLNMENVRVENGRVLFSGNESAIARANIALRTGERVLLVLADFEAKTFEQLFQGVYRAELENVIPKDGAFPVKGHCLNSTLMSVPDCQAIVKKAASKRLGEKYGVSWLPETGTKYQLQFSLMNDRCVLYLDTTGQGLHKRGYRAIGNDAPLHETLAAGMIQLARFRGREFFWDPFCGSGTIPIEAALIAKNRAPGLNRNFAAEKYPWMPESAWKQAKEEAKDLEFNGSYRIMGSDNDPTCVSLAFANARKAGVADCVTFKDGDATKMSLPAESGILVCNPPYGERMLTEEECTKILKNTCQMYKKLDNWALMLLTPDENFEKIMGRKADKRRKIYNGMIRCNLYQYFSKKH